MRRKPVDIFLFGGLPEAGMLVLRQLRELAIKPGVLWLWTEHDHRIFSDNRDLLERVYLPGGFTNLAPWFVSEYNRRYGEQPDLYAAIAHDGAETLFAALEAGEVQTAEQLVQAMIKNPPRRTACEGFHFHSDHTVQMPLDLSIFENGALRVFTSELGRNTSMAARPLS